MSAEKFTRSGDASGVHSSGKGATFDGLMTMLAETAPALTTIATAIQAAPASPRLTVTPEEAAESLGVSRDSFDRYVKPELRVIRRGRLVLVPVSELVRWVDENMTAVLE